MDLLFQSKRAWLLSFLIFVGLDAVIYYFGFNIDWLNTICLMMGAMLVGMAVFFIFISIFRWTAWTRRIVTVLYIGAIAYGWINGYISRWYVIIPTGLVMFLFMMWNLGGVKNCIIASPYKSALARLGARMNAEYNDYSSGVDRYNNRNGFGIFTKVRKKRRPNLMWYSFNSTGLDMFALEDAFLGVSTADWESKIGKLNSKIGKLMDKNDAIYADETISEERSVFKDIRNQNRELGIYDPNHDLIMNNLDDKKKTGIKKQKKILKKWL